MLCLAGLSLALCFSGIGCRSTYYSVMEKFGKHKRDLLKEEVEEARNDQVKASEQFKDALTRLKEFYGIPGGDLEKTYRQFSDDYEKCTDRAQTVRKRVATVEQLAGDLFKEWAEEIETYASAKLKANSQAKYEETRKKYESLHAAMKKAEQGMEPVLVLFRDQVLYLKHNLNAQAIGALKGEVLDIEREIGALIRDMNKSIAEADAFINTL
jgi:hypothetical protein